MIYLIKKLISIISNLNLPYKQNSCRYIYLLGFQARFEEAFFVFFIIIFTQTFSETASQIHLRS